MENLESQDDFPRIKHSLVHPVPISNMYISYTMYKYSISIIIFILQFAGVSIALSDEVDEKHHKQRSFKFFWVHSQFFFISPKPLKKINLFFVTKLKFTFYSPVGISGEQD